MKDIIKKIGKVILICISSFVVLGGTVFISNRIESSLRRDAQQFEISPIVVKFEENFDNLDLDKWDKYEYKDGKTIDLSPANYTITESILNLGVTPRTDFEQQKDKYNNSYLLTKESISLQEYKVETKFKASRDLTGSTGVWVNAVDKNGSIWSKGIGGGFKGAFGISYLSVDSQDSGLDGLKFLLVKGWSPQCSIDVPDEINPFVYNTYGIVSKKGQFDAYVNDQYIGSCKDWTNIVSDYKIQLWTDNYLVSGWFELIPNLLGVQYINPNSPQFSQFDYVKVLGNE